MNQIAYVTGCLGFIGSVFTKKLLEKGWHVYGVDAITYAANSSLIEEFKKYKKFKFIKQHIQYLDRLEECDYVFNFAAESHVENSIMNSNAFMETNINGVKNLLELVRAKPINSATRPIFFHISTDEVYGDISHGAHTELDPLKPSNPYSATKAAADMLVIAWGRTYDIEYNIVRPTNNYGPSQHPEKLIPSCLRNLERGRKIKLHNMGMPVRTWLHVTDTADAVLAVTEHGKRNEIYNVSGNYECTNNIIVNSILEEYFKNTNYNRESYIDYGFNRQGQDVRYALNDEKLKALGWNPSVDFSLAIADIVKSFKQEKEIK
jgi:dTDP-glucose 4,6-dehydratase